MSTSASPTTSTPPTRAGCAGVMSATSAKMPTPALLTRTSRPPNRATVASTVTYLVPLFSTAAGVLLLGERMGWNEPLGALLVVLGHEQLLMPQ